MEKNKIWMIIIIVLLLVLIGAVAGVSVYAVSLINKTAAEPSVNVTGQPKVLTQNDVVLVKVNDTINTDLLAGSDKKSHAIRLNVGISVDNTDEDNSQQLIALLAEREVVVLDIVLSTVRNKTFDDLKGENKDAMEILRNEILQKLRAEFDTNLIVHVYINNIVLQ